MKKFLIAVIALLGLATVLLVGYSYKVSAPLFDATRGSFEPAIAPLHRALTFARTDSALLLVTSQDAGQVSGRNLTAALGQQATADLVSLYQRLGFDGLVSLEAPGETAALQDLRSPLKFRYPHIAAGTNFKEHAEEVYLDDPPFLFPKLVEAGPWQADVPHVSRLDYEAELCMFPLSDINRPDQAVEYGLVLCNDFTDRWTLVRQIDLSRPMGETGFAAGKGCRDCLPTGYLAVIPREPDFYRKLKLKLFVNDEQRQAFETDQMILSIDDLVSQAFRQAGAHYQQGEQKVALVPEGYIPARTLLLTGTAAGILFKPLNIWNQGFYLQPGDVVRTEATYLGHLSNRVTTKD